MTRRGIRQFAGEGISGAARTNYVGLFPAHDSLIMYRGVSADIFRLATGNKGLASRLRLAMTHRAWLLLLVAVLASIAGQPLGAINDAAAAEQKIRTFQVRGTIREIKADRKSVVIAHERIPDYMGAMTMPFRVKSTNELSGLRIGDIVSFRLSVTESESWIDHLSKVGASTNSVLLSPTLSSKGGEG